MVHTATGFYDFAFFPSLSEVILLMVFVGPARRIPDLAEPR